MGVMMRMVWMVLILATLVTAKPKPKGKADPEAWDWQHEPSSYPAFKPVYPSIKLDQPQFLKINRDISVVVGETAFLPCRVKNLNTYTVSWIRAGDVSVLSVGHLAFSSDKRISVVQVPRPRLSASDWNLSIEGATLEDDGMYECQVNTEPKITGTSSRPTVSSRSTTMRLRKMDFPCTCMRMAASVPSFSLGNTNK